MIINDHILKLTGKVSLLEYLEMGKSYTIKLKGDITSVTDSDNQDGTINRQYRFEPILVIDNITEKNRSIGTKDPKKLSQRLRSRCYIYDQEHQTEGTYESILPKLIAHFDGVVDYLNNIK